MRVTETMKASRAVAAARITSTRFDRAARRAQTGERVSVPSDEPSTFALLSRLDARASLVEARSKASQLARTDLEVAEGALASAADILVRAKEIAVAMANGHVDAGTRAAAAVEVDALREQLVQLGNTRGPSGYVFSGNRTDTPAFAANGVFQGDDGTRSVEIADGKVVRANASGARAFTALGGRDVLADLATFAADLRNDNMPGIRAAVDGMSALFGQVMAARVDAGLRAEQLRAAADVLDGSLLAIRKARAAHGDVDAVSAFSELVAAQQAYERSLAVTRQLLSLSAASSGG
jgi:flagellar hook-associated protein 3 FlgL